MRSRSITRVVILGVIAILGIIGLQSYWLYQSYNLETRTFDERARIALMEVAENIAEYNGGDLPSYEIVVRESPNYYVVNIDDVIDANVLEHYLETTFARHALILDFEYAVFDCHTKEMVYGNYCPMMEENQVQPDEKPLPKYDEFTYYFGVRFLSKDKYIFREMGKIWTVTGILGITLLFFAYAIYVILTQKRYSEMQKDFINNMTHEFKTPISSIKVSADVLAKDPNLSQMPRAKQYIQIIRDQNMRLNDQVEQVLQLAKMDKNHFKSNPELLSLNELVQEVAQAHRMRIQSQEGTLEVNMPSKSVSIQADRSHLINVLNNLIDNAIKYAKNQPHIVISLQPKDKEVLLSVKDFGIGISKQHIHKITEQFYRVPSGNVHNVKGFGLGLYYVKSVCQSHGWTFTIDSVETEWTEAQLLIPMEI